MLVSEEDGVLGGPDLLERLIVDIVKQKRLHKPSASSWQTVARKTTCCILQHMQGINTRWAKDDKEWTVCRVCFNAQRLCLRWEAKLRRFYACALPAETREGIRSDDVRYYVYGEANASKEVERSYGQLWIK